MKKSIAIFAAVPFVFAAQTAFAAPLSGPYIGVQGSHESYEIKAKNMAYGSATVSADGLSANGKSGGIYAGYDLAVAPSAFVGLEAGFDYSGAGASIGLTDGTNSMGAGVKARESFSIAARLGLAVANRTGLYAKLGYANTRFKTRVHSNNLDQFTDSRSKGAFVYGGGLEAGVAQNIAVRAEFTVADYGSAGLNEDFGVNGMKVSNSKTSVGVSYRF